MKSIFTSLFTLLCFSTLAFAQQTINGSLTHDELQREYILYVPDAYTGEESVPLLFNFHGYTSNAFEQMFYGNFRPIADVEGFLIVHPLGTEDITGTTHFNVGWGASSVDDVGFTEALLDAIASEYNIDLNRVYSTGMSNGGFMSYELACQLSDKIAAIASVTGSMSPPTFNNCNPQHPTPILQIHGTNDETVPYDGATFSKPIEEVVAYWVDFNNCDSTPTVTELPDTDTTDGSTVEQFVYANGDNGVNTEFYKITNGGHTWAGTFFGSPGTNYDINASAVVWDFLSRYDLNGLIDTTTDLEDVEQQDFQIRIFPNPTTDLVFLELDDTKDVPFEVFSAVGKSVLKGIVNAQQPMIDLSNLVNDIYFLKIGGESFRVLRVE